MFACNKGRRSMGTAVLLKALAFGMCRMSPPVLVQSLLDRTACQELRRKALQTPDGHLKPACIIIAIRMKTSLDSCR